MKTLKLVSILIILTFGSLSLQAQTSSNVSEITIKVSSQCEMCKEKIEEHLAFEKGVKKSEVNLKKNEVVITYNPKRTNPEKLRKSIAKLGYDADGVKANCKAYSKLPDCCKKPEDRSKKKKCSSTCKKKKA